MGGGCPYCSNYKALLGYNDLATTHPEIAAQWCPEKNVPLTLSEAVDGSNCYVWWECSSGHVWNAPVYSRTGQRKSGCPVCAGRMNTDRLDRYVR